MTATVLHGDFAYVAELVRRRAGIVLEAGKEYLVETRLQFVIKRLGCPSIAQLVQQLRESAFGDLHQQVVEAMTTNETCFFRDPKFYEALQTGVIPDLLERRAKERRLRIWCAASSSGQEPYSVLMLLREHFPVLDSWRVELIASDISREMQVRTREGRYTQLEVNRGLPARMLVKYFDRQGLEWQAKAELRALLDVREVNLVQPWQGLSEVDIVFLRNVLIYFDEATKAGVLARVHATLRPDGYLFLGAAETPAERPVFRRVALERAGCYQPGKVTV